MNRLVIKICRCEVCKCQQMYFQRFKVNTLNSHWNLEAKHQLIKTAFISWANWAAPISNCERYVLSVGPVQTCFASYIQNEEVKQLAAQVWVTYFLVFPCFLCDFCITNKLRWRVIGYSMTPGLFISTYTQWNCNIYTLLNALVSFLKIIVHYYYAKVTTFPSSVSGVTQWLLRF